LSGKICNSLKGTISLAASAPNFYKK